MTITPTLRLYEDDRVSALSGGDLESANAVLRRYPDGRISAVTVDELTEWEPGVPSGGSTVWRTWLAPGGTLIGPEFSFLPGWQAYSYAELCSVIAGMP